MVTVLYKGILVMIFLICGTFSILTIQQAHGVDELVTTTFKNNAGVIVAEYKNNEGNIFDIKSIVMEIGQGGNFKSFKTEKGWVGKRTSEDTITFTSSSTIKPGQSAKFGIKTDQSRPNFTWKVFDEEGDELGSGEQIVARQPRDDTVTENNKPGGPSAILDSSIFKLIPDTPKVGASLRIVGESFGANQKLDFYIGTTAIESTTTDGNGNFILSTKIPDNQKAERVDFIIRDQNGNQKSMSLRILESTSRSSVQTAELTVKGDKIFHRGDEKTISGTVTPGSTLTVSISDSSGQVLTSFVEKADGSGVYAIKHRVPADRPFGEYVITITDGKDTVSHRYTVETTQKIHLTTTKQKYDPGETVVINGTALPNQPIEIIITDPVKMEVYSSTVAVGADGKVTLQYPLDTAVREGTYVIFATQGDEHETFLVGIGEIPQVQLIARMSAINYKTIDNAVIYITGPASSTVNFVLVDPSDKQKFTDTITIGVDGYYEYSFGLTGYSPGVYTAVLSRGNSHVEERFSVGLQTGSGPITINTIKDKYSPGEGFLILGESNPNVIITVSFINPNGTKVKTVDLFTDKKGIFTSNAFRIPIDIQSGVWTIEAKSGLNHTLKQITVTAMEESGLSIWLDRDPPTYFRDQIIVITGSGAGRSHNLEIDIFGANQTEIQSLSIIATGTGSFSTIWKVPTDFSIGTYTIKLVDVDKSVETTFNISQ